MYLKEEVPLGDVEMEGKGSLFLKEKALAVAEEKKQLMKYLEKKKVEMKLWDNLLQKYQCDLNEAKRFVQLLRRDVFVDAGVVGFCGTGLGALKNCAYRKRLASSFHAL